ncbi:phosphorylase family protein [Alkaliflexus imshenetskii]|uniref:phosphorylase family protein n=1 Tax=Alkaliflexus imshenetskii TaxID=286730 RepID=UPI0004B419E6|nr:5'-methylthioadenosine nucleosidase [Alkaliflexus imshenetskii]
MHICFIIAMEAEAASLIEKFSLDEVTHFASGLPMWAWSGLQGADQISVVVNGKDADYNLDLIGTQAATLSTHLAINHFKPDMIISAGTAGAFQSKGANIGDVYLSYPHVVFHDRRVDIPGWDKMGVGRFPVYDVREMALTLKLKTGVVTTGNSLDMPETDEATIRAIGGEIKEMEAAAVAWVASLHKVPMFCVKSVTDLVDSAHPTHEQFLSNLRLAVESLTEVCLKVVGYILVHKP